MFLNESIFKKMLAYAFKGPGLVIRQDENGWMYIKGAWWELYAMRKFIGKKTMGNIISMVGELPEAGECYTATKEGNQMSFFDGCVDYKIGLPVKVTDVLTINEYGHEDRILQSEYTGMMYPINNVYVNCVDNAEIKAEDGEDWATQPCLTENEIPEGIVWKNNVGRFFCKFSESKKTKNMIEKFAGIDLAEKS